MIGSVESCTPRLTCVEHIIWCIFEKATTFWTPYGHFEYIMMSFDLTNTLDEQSTNIWMISWFVTLTTSSFFPRTWQTINGMYILFWTSSRKSNFTPNQSNVNFINWSGIIKLRHFWIWHFMEHYKVQTIVDWATSTLVHDVQCFKLDSLTFPNVSLCTIPQLWPFLFI